MLWKVLRHWLLVVLEEKWEIEDVDGGGGGVDIMSLSPVR